MNVIYPPNELDIPENHKSVFLAGSIDMGFAIDWQAYIIEELEDSKEHENLSILNPRRADWDASWEATKDNPEFTKQVNWELDGLEKADLIIMYLAPNTKSPITLLELGLHAQDKKLVVCCDEKFWRIGNVDIVCQRYGIKKVDSLEGLITEIKKMVTESNS